MKRAGRFLSRRLCTLLSASERIQRTPPAPSLGTLAGPPFSASYFFSDFFERITSIADVRDHSILAILASGFVGSRRLLCEGFFVFLRTKA